ncbi:glycosyltransferase [Flavitalea sp. BT771]|nr:glycosyltransferase [Flavitalea sp. BT771]MDO6433553.1 glycosyltransferase [Flavitalea sp. BT771]MDV6222542.1 glycosyltransferase [Flavitalea sp. BT771]
MGDQKELLKKEFPFLSFVELPGYHIRYGKNRAFTFLRLIGSIPKILTRVKEEGRWLRQFRDQTELDAVISDNRYGLWGKGIYSVFITHQLGLRTSLGSWVDRWAQRLHYRLIERFSICWVPDWERGSGLAGKLSHPPRMPAVPARYIGILTRMEGLAQAEGSWVDLLVLLSGPEPQRTILEKKVLGQLGAFSGKVVLVRGLPGGGGPLEVDLREVEVHDHLPARALNEILLRTKLVVARAGYSTVMDLVRLGKKAILIPTPGQTEQEYLGKYLSDKKIAFCTKQAEFSLANALVEVEKFPFVPVEEERNSLQGAIAALLEKINPSPLSI